MTDHTVSFTTSTTSCATTVVHPDGSTKVHCPEAWYREALRHIYGALGPLHSKWATDNLDEGLNVELSVVLPMVLNVLCGLPPGANTVPGEAAETWDELDRLALEARKRCEAVWREHGFRLGNESGEVS